MIIAIVVMVILVSLLLGVAVWDELKWRKHYQEILKKGREK